MTDATEDRLARLRQREERLAAELVATPWHLKGTPWETDRLECLERTRRQIEDETKKAARTWTATLVPCPPKPVAEVVRNERMHQRFIDYRAELAARHHAFVRKSTY